MVFWLLFELVIHKALSSDLFFSAGLHLSERRSRLCDEQGRCQEAGHGRPHPRGQLHLPGQDQAPQRGRGPGDGLLCHEAEHSPDLK